MQKSMFSLVILIMTLSVNVFAQSTKQTVTIKTKIYCDHCTKCESCKARVENKVYELKGIRAVEMSAKDETIKVVFNSKKISLSQIKTQINKAGYDADEQKAKAEDVAKLTGAVKNNKYMSNKNHWENVFQTKEETEVSWYQKVPQTSIELLTKYGISKDANIIDVGCGDSYFIDYLVENGYKNIYALDISEKALERLKARLGDKINNVHWIVSDVLEYRPDINFDFWHDRASFHFQTERENIDRYAENVKKNVASQGIIAIGTFSETGPKKCSGLDITQYNADTMSEEFKPSFVKEECSDENHTTPFNTTQDFIFCVFKKQ